MKKLEFFGEVIAGRLAEETARMVGLAIRQFDGKRVAITIAELKRKRSNPQNRYYWGCVVPAVLQMFVEAGNAMDVEEIHAYLKEHIGKLKKVVIDPAGMQRVILCSTTRLSTAEFEVYMDRIRAWAAEFGTVIALPNEYLGPGWEVHGVHDAED